ncbi:MAG TPA: alanine dehydrogenase [Chitinophagales bacterium]|nr:alanine dehydrogenase [Chitinophagales bacterium]
MESIIGKFKTDYSLYTKEVLADIQNGKKSLYIGIPKETEYQEKRVPLTPNSVAALVNYGFRVVVEKDAGENSNFSNEEYVQAGADIVYTKEDVFKAETIIKSGPINPAEIRLLQNNQTIFSPILLPNQTKSNLKSLMEKRVTAIAFEYVKGDYNTYPFMRSMSEIAGNYAIIVAAKYLSNEYGKGILLGGIAGQPPAKVLILGAGTVGEAAAKSALALGASVQVFDDNIFRLSRLQKDLGNKIYTSVIDPINLAKNIARSHVVIGALKPKNGKTPCVVTEDMVRSMKKDSVIIDVSIDNGGCFETSQVTNHDEPIFTKHDVIHYCVPNIASNVSRTASYALSNILSPILKNAANAGSLESLIKIDNGILHGTYLYKGALTKDFIAKKFDLKFTDLELLLSADF